MATIKPEVYAHSPVHFAVVLGDHTSLSRLVSSLPKLNDSSQIHTESDSLSQERLADQISGIIDRRDNPNGETPLHLAVKINDVFAVTILAKAGADISLQNAAGWNPLQEAVCRKCSEIVTILVQHHHVAAWSKWRRRLPRLVTALHKMRDFYMEISFHFESSIVPFVGKIAPSDTYKIWKRDGNLRADTSLAGYDGLKIQRANQSFLFFGDQNPDVPAGSLLVLNHDEDKIFDAFETSRSPLNESDIDGFCAQTSVYRPGIDVTKAELVGRTNWRKQEKTESIGEWKAKVFDIHNIVFSFRSRKISTNEGGDGPGSEQILPLELEEDSDEGFLVAENPRFSVSDNNRRRHSSYVNEDRDLISVSRKSVDIIPERRKFQRAPRALPPVVILPNQTKEKEYVKSLHPSVWLTEHFPLKTEELLPLLDILANKVKAVRRMRELLTTKFPPGTFPVKIAIPVVPTVRVVITFTKFIELQPIEQFYTPLSSPRFLGKERNTDEQSSSESSAYSWLSRNSGRAKKQQQLDSQNSDPFTIPKTYSWSSFNDKSKKTKKTKSTRKTTK